MQGAAHGHHDPIRRELNQDVTRAKKATKSGPVFIQGAMLRSWLEQQVLPEFSGRTLPIDTAVAQRCARLHVPDRCGERDALIAATALVHGMAVVTRNVAGFEPTGVIIVNLWEPSP